MSRESNNLQRHVEECLVERDEMFEWIRNTQRLVPWLWVSERDWLFFGHLSLGEWLQDRALDIGEDPWDDWEPDPWGWDDVYDEWDQRDQRDDELPFLQDDWGEYWEPPDLEYGGCQYPREHVEHARGMR